MCIATRDIMDGVLGAYYSQENNGDPIDIPEDKGPVWILGKQYRARGDIEAIYKEINSKVWFTYRKDFVPIGGGDGPTSDRGWGCMLRCGQMVMAETLIRLHMDSDWIWTLETRDPTYLKIIQKFEDKRNAPYSIHQIAQMGSSEGKPIGEWFGPNTVAQVLKKLSKSDSWSSLTVHVALDNLLVMEEVRQICLGYAERETSISLRNWKPLLLIIPLRLGLTEINKIYYRSFQACFKFPYCVGAIGGKPKLALYFIGCIGSEVLYLDPHYVQRTGTVGNKDSEDEKLLDATYHTKQAHRSDIKDIDPSLALCFFCKTENDFNDLCDKFRNEVMIDNEPMFEVCESRVNVTHVISSMLREAMIEPGVLEPTSSDDGFEFI